MLSSGESIEWQLECPLPALPEMQPKVDGYLAWDAFFGIPQDVPIPSAFTQPSILKYVRAFGGIELHRALTPRIKDIALPGAQTTFAEVQALTQSLTKSLASIDDTLTRLSACSGFAVGPDARSHFEAAAIYLREERAVREALKEAILSAQSERITEVANSFNDLEPFASGLNQATEELVAKYNIPEEEARGFRVE